MNARGLMLGAALFAGAGAASRLTFRHVETRWQIAAFCAAAILVEAAYRQGRFSARAARAALMGGCAAVAIVGIKAYLEPQHMRAGLHAVRQDARRIVP